MVGLRAGSPSILGGVLDRSVVFSFDASGFRRHARRFAAHDLDVDMNGKVCLVTGANAGIGRQTAEALAQRGATVYLLCRHSGRGQTAEAEIRKKAGHARVFFEPVDMSLIGSVREFAERFAPERVDVLVHNAGVLPDTLFLTKDGLELTWATNVFGPFLLTQLLQEKLRVAAGRVIWVSSGGMYTQRLDLSDLTWHHRRFDGMVAYAQSKRAEVILTELMAERWADLGMTVHAMHPGWADTRSVRFSLPRFHRLTKTILRTPAQGADTVVWLAVCARPVAQSGRFWFDRAPAPTHMMRRTVESEAQREALWTLCETVAGSTLAGYIEAWGRCVPKKQPRCTKPTNIRSR